MDKVVRNEDKNNRDNEGMIQETNQLDEYEESFKAKLEGLSKELVDMTSFEDNLKKTKGRIENTLNQKESLRQEAEKMKNQMQII